MSIFNNKKNIMIILGVLILIIVVTTLSYTYAYFTFRADNDDTITGDAGTPELKLTVAKIIPTESNNGLKLVPLLNSAISNAVAGTGGQSSCIDANGNLSCQIYKITVENTGTVNLTTKGTIELKAIGTNNIFSNLKWRQLENTTTVKSGSSINSMTETTLVENEKIIVDQKKEYYFALWISEINSDQSSADYGDFYGIIKFLDNNGKGVTATFDS